MIEDAFLADIIAAPDDDAPRLIYADWLEDHGQQERAEFIRVQIQRERLDRWDVRQVALAQREADLLAQYGKAWAGLATRCGTWQFRRGFIENIRSYIRQFRPHATDLFRQHPIRRIIFWWDSDLPDFPELQRVDWLYLGGCHDYEEMDLLLSPHWTGLTSLHIESRPQDGDELVRTLKRVPWRHGLKDFHLRGTGLTSQGVQELADGVLPALERLTINFNEEMQGEGAIRLLQGSGLPHLRELCLRGIGLGSRDAERLATMPELERLRHLDLSYNRMESGGANLVASRHLCHLETLELYDIDTEAHLLSEALAQSPHLSQLRTLSPCVRRFGPSHLEQLLQSEALRGLTRLNLCSLPLGPEGARLLGSESNHWQLHELVLSNTSLGDEGVAALLSPRLATLRSLYLDENKLGSDSAAALARSEHLHSLRSLNLMNNRIGDDGADALARSETLQLLHLQLENNAIYSVAQSALKARYGHCVSCLI